MTTHPSDSSAGAAEVDAARLLLARMGIDPADLPARSDGPAAPGRPMPTITEWIDVVSSLVSPGTARSYGSYWKKAVAAWGDRRLDQVSASDIRALSYPLPDDTELAQPIQVTVLARTQQDAVWSRQQIDSQVRYSLKDLYTAALAAFAGLGEGGLARRCPQQPSRRTHPYPDRRAACCARPDDSATSTATSRTSGRSSAATTQLDAGSERSVRLDSVKTAAHQCVEEVRR